MEMLKYDPKLQYDSYYVGSLFRNPEKSKEWHEQIAKEKLEKCGFTDHLKMNMQLKLEELHFTSSMARAWSNMVVDELPKEYYQNICEWIEGKPLTYLKYNDLSIREIMEHGKEVRGEEYGFLHSSLVFAKYVKGIYKSKERCYDYFFHA